MVSRQNVERKMYKAGPQGSMILKVFPSCRVVFLFPWPSLLSRQVPKAVFVFWSPGGPHFLPWNPETEAFLYLEPGQKFSFGPNKSLECRKGALKSPEISVLKL